MSAENGNCGGQKNQTPLLTLANDLDLSGDQPNKWDLSVSGTLPTLAGSSNPNTYLSGKTIESLCYDWQGLLDIESSQLYNVMYYSPDRIHAMTVRYMRHGKRFDEMLGELLSVLNRR